MKSDKAYCVSPSSVSNRNGHKKFNIQRKAEREIFTGERQMLCMCQMLCIHLSILITTLQGRNYYPYFTNDETEAQKSWEVEQVAVMGFGP